MELQIQDLVTSIRKEGVEAASAEAEAIIAEAKKKADTLVSNAQAEAQQYKDAAEKEINILKENAGRAQYLAQKTLRKVYKKVGLYQP